MIRDQDVKQALRSYYGHDQGQRQYISLNLMVEIRYFELSAGIMPLDQHRLVQDEWFVVNPANLARLQDVHPEESEIRATAGRLRSNAQLLAWLPRVRGLQIDQINAHNGRLENTRSLLNTLQQHVVRLSE